MADQFKDSFTFTSLKFKGLESLDFITILFVLQIEGSNQ